MKHTSAITDIINSISEARKAKNLTQTELGKRLGLPQSYISKLESGRLDIRISTMIEIARYLNLEIMMVPTAMAPTMHSVMDTRTSTQKEPAPLYTLDDLEGEFEGN